MITNFNIKNLFSLPLYIVKIDPNSYDKKAFMDVVKHNYKIDPTRCNHHPQNDEFGNLHHSFADVGNKKFKDVDYVKIGLNDIYNNIFKDFCDEIKTTQPFKYSWTLENYTCINKSNQYMRSHQHLPGDDFAAVHYINFNNEEHEGTSFINQNTFSQYMRYVRPDLYNLVNHKEEENSYLYRIYNCKPQEDEMVIFPACLEHEIPRQKKDTENLRVTVACNLRIEKPQKQSTFTLKE